MAKRYQYKKKKFSLQYIKMSGKNINFNDKKIKKSIFYKSKAINNIEGISFKKRTIW